MQINSLKFSKCSLEKNLSNSHRALVAESQTEALVISLPELQENLKTQPQRESLVKTRVLIGKDGLL